MEKWHIILIIVLVLAVIWSNIALLKYSAKFDMKKFNQDPVDKAKKSLAEKQNSNPTDEQNDDHTNQ